MCAGEREQDEQENEGKTLISLCRPARVHLLSAEFGKQPRGREELQTRFRLDSVAHALPPVLILSSHGGYGAWRHCVCG